MNPYLDFTVEACAERKVNHKWEWNVHFGWICQSLCFFCI